jgi:restriction endonuclease S subunit
MMPEASIFDSIDFPKHWKRQKLRWVFENRKVQSCETETLLGVNISLGVTERYDGDGRPAASEDLSKYKLVEPGDIILNPLGKPHGSIGRSNVSGITSPAYWVLRTDEQNYSSRFMHYLLRSEPMLDEFRRRSKNLPPNQFDLSWEQFRDIQVPIPSFARQIEIASFLDDQTGKTRQIIRAKNQQLDLLRLESQNATLEWLFSKNDISAKKFSWEEAIGHYGIKAKYLFKLKAVTNIEAPLASATMFGVSLRSEQDKDVWNPEDSTDSYKLVEPGDFVIGLRSFQHGFSFSEVRGKVSPAYSVFSLRPKYSELYRPDYFAHLFQHRSFIDILESIAVGIRQGKNIPYESFAQILIPVPDFKTHNFAVTKQKKNQVQIDLLKSSLRPLEEYLRSLVSSAVIGKSFQEKIVS